MVYHTLPILLLLTTFAVTTKIATATTTTTTTTTMTNNFIKSKCRSTTYPLLCVQSLSNYATTIRKSPRQLAQTALVVSLGKARYAKAYMAQFSHTRVLKPKEVGVVQDCMEQIGDTVDRLGRSIHEFQISGRARSWDVKWHMSNVQTWASAAITDLCTCVDESNALNWRIKSGIKAQFMGVMQCTSNALALVNQFANKYSP
ncbi:21 kDa protein-like [Silene latifolia]|uniref:21 kDa protein-like n=1 Tax=Silene latifolia TaxID=37657 RepID=UPI003D7871CA